MATQRKADNCIKKIKALVGPDKRIRVSSGFGYVYVYFSIIQKDRLKSLIRLASYYNDYYIDAEGEKVCFTIAL